MTDPIELVPAAWRSRLAAAASEPAFARTLADVELARQKTEVFPPRHQVFAALELTPPESVRVVILGQDPYPTPGYANGLAFSVSPGVRIPASLRNILRSLNDDLSYDEPASGSLEPWARQGVLLLNTILTVPARKPGGHRELGWQAFTNAVIRAVNDLPVPVVFLLWGKHAQAKETLITAPPHIVLKTTHPSPLSARLGFLRDRPLLAANEALLAANRPPIDWRLQSDTIGPRTRKAGGGTDTPSRHRAASAGEPAGPGTYANAASLGDRRQLTAE